MSEAATGDATMELRVVSAHEEIFSGAVRMVSATSTNGELGILPRHAPLLTLLRPAEVRVLLASGEEHYLYVSGGMMEVQPFMVTILADTAARGEEIDEAAALEAKQRAEEAMRDAVLYSERDAAQTEMVKALAQLRALEHSRRRRKR